MQRIVERPGALDVHQATVMACVRAWENRVVTEHVAEFKTTVHGLLALRDWLESLGVRQVAMEATGVYWYSDDPYPRRHATTACRSASRSWRRRGATARCCGSPQLSRPDPSKQSATRRWSRLTPDGSNRTWRHRLVCLRQTRLRGR